jgi:hypothetical protein
LYKQLIAIVNLFVKYAELFAYTTICFEFLVPQKFHWQYYYYYVNDDGGLQVFFWILVLTIQAQYANPDALPLDSGVSAHSCGSLEVSLAAISLCLKGSLSIKLLWSQLHTHLCSSRLMESHWCRALFVAVAWTVDFRWRAASEFKICKLIMVGTLDTQIL